MIWPGVIAPSCLLCWSTPVTVIELKLTERGPLRWMIAGPPPKPFGPAAPCWLSVCFGTRPETWIAFSVKPPTAELTPASFEIEVTFEAGKLSCEFDTKLSVEKRVPGLRLRKSRRWPPFSCCSSWRSFSLRRPTPKPPESFDDVVWKLIGRVTDMSVPTPVSGSRTFACASFRPCESAFTVTTSATPIARPSAVKIVRPLRRRSSARM